ncbi:MAG: hypothetical protein WKF86_05505 [Acidimicrobiales bacterium]
MRTFSPTSPGGEVEGELVQQQVHLPGVRKLGPPALARAVLDGDAGVGVALDSDTLDQRDRRNRFLAEPVTVAAANGDDPTLALAHATILPRAAGDGDSLWVTTQLEALVAGWRTRRWSRCGPNWRSGAAAERPEREPDGRVPMPPRAPAG